MPIKPAKVEDFITEFDVYVNHWKLETMINQEDGRPFGYEVDHKFFDNLIEQSLDSTLLPYDTITSSNADGSSDLSSETKILGGFPGSSGLDSLISSLASITGLSGKTVPKGKFPKLRNSDWIDLITIVPDLGEAHASYTTQVAHLKDEDMELNLEHDLLLSTDHEYVASKLKESAKKYWELAAAVPHCRPINTKVTLIPQAHDYKPPIENGEPRHANCFDYGMKIPTGKSNEIDNSQILDPKKHSYAQILKENIDCKKLEQEISNADPTRVFDASNYITPTVASVFAEHEILAWLQLRHIKIREARIKLVRQFNFFRSVEKRLTFDMQRAKIDLIEPDNIKDSVVDMWRRMEFFDVTSAAGLKGQNPQDSKFKIETSNEDIRSIVNDRIQLTDKKGHHFLYDVAISDMEKFETEAKKILTIYINGASGVNSSPISSYLEELRPKFPKFRDQQSHVTFLNPQADRAQILLEFYESHIDYQYAKIECINNYLEVFEHTIDPEKSTDIVQIIVNIIHSKPILEFDQEYFSKNYSFATQSLGIQSSLLGESMLQIKERHRDWAKRYSMVSTLNETDGDIVLEGNSKSATAGVSDSEITSFSSELEIGLPRATFKVPFQSIIMHHPGMLVEMTEIIPALENVTSIWHSFVSISNEVSKEIESLAGSDYSRIIVETTVIKTLKVFKFFINEILGPDV